MQIVRPDFHFEKSFRDGLAELATDKERREWVCFYEDDYPDFYSMAFSDYVNRLLEFEVTPPPPWVPTTIYWAIEESQVVGRIAIRHELNEFLFYEGGHIGYFVRPSSRSKGFATAMLKQILETDRAKKIGNLLVTCDEGNSASEKTILKNGGQLENVVSFELGRVPKKRFWIHLEGPIEIVVVMGRHALDRNSYFYKTVGYPLRGTIEDVFVVAKIGERVIGAVRCAREDGTAVLRGMSIHSAFYRQGIGSTMLHAFKEILVDRGIAVAYLLCPPRLRGFYGTIGFKECSKESAPSFLVERRESYVRLHGDQIVMKYQREI